MGEKICPKCGEKTNGNFCQNCGQDMTQVVTNEKEVKDDVKTHEVKIAAQNPQKNSKNIIIIVLAVVVVALGVLLFINMNSTPGIIVDDETGETTEDVSSSQNQGRSLPGGKYTVGEDISAGKYFLIYKTEQSEDDYWSNDYIWITRNGSKGENETLGGDKYDERIGDADYADAKKGKSFFVNLKSGDEIIVDSSFGEWTY